MQVYDHPATIQEVKVALPASVPPADGEPFFPKGAIAFFVLLVLLGLIIWFGIYFLMLSRI